MTISLPKLKCNKCKHEWTPRKSDVRQCPECKTAYWNKEEEDKDEE